MRGATGELLGSRGIEMQSDPVWLCEAYGDAVTGLVLLRSREEALAHPRLT